MRIYKLLTEDDILPNHRYDAIVHYPYPSPNRKPMTDSVFYDKYRQWCGTDKDITAVIDESVISVLMKEDPDRAAQIIQGGYEEDGLYNDLLRRYDYHIGGVENEVPIHR